MSLVVPKNKYLRNTWYELYILNANKVYNILITQPAWTSYMYMSQLVYVLLQTSILYLKMHQWIFNWTYDLSCKLLIILKDNQLLTSTR